MTDINWVKMLGNIDKAFQHFTKLQVRPTLRTLFYYLYSKGLLPNTISAYHSLSRNLVQARKDGRYPWNALQDTTRSVYGELDDGSLNTSIEDVEGKLERLLEDLDVDSALESYFDYEVPSFSVGKWTDQPVVPEVWIEKEALAATIQRWVGAGITIRPNKGFSSWTFIHENVEALKSVLERHDKVVIYYLGDLDPSGVDMDRFLKEALEYFELDPTEVEFKRLAITGEQVERYHLPPKPEDAQTLAKLSRDPRMKAYKSEYIVELDALVAYVPEEFKKEVVEAVNTLWNPSIYNQLREEATALEDKAQQMLEDIKERAIEKLKNG